MVVNINPCASTYDETLQALKFSAIATQVVANNQHFFVYNLPASFYICLCVCMSYQLVHGPSSKTRVAYILQLLREQAAHSENTLMEEEEESDDEGDLTMFDTEVSN